MRFLKFIFLISIISFLGSCFLGKPKKFNAITSAPFLQINSARVDSLIETMTLEEKIGQLIWVSIENNLKDDFQKEETFKQLTQLPFGAVLYDKSPSSDFSNFQKEQILQDSLKIPLLFGMLPHSSETLGDYELTSIKTDSIFQRKAEFERALLKRNNLQISFNANLNSITQRDSLVQDSSFIYQLNNNLSRNNFLINTYQETGVLTGVKQVSDFHYRVLDTSIIHEERLFPYQNLAQSYVSMMVLDSQVFNLDTLQPLPDNAIRNYLVDSFYFGGLAISYYQNPKLLREQLRTGSDAFIVPLNETENAINIIKKAVENNIITSGLLDFSVRKNLLAKEWSNSYLTEEDTILPDLFTLNLVPLTFDIAEQSISILKNEVNLLPITTLKKENILLIDKNGTDLQLYGQLSHYANVEEYSIYSSEKHKIDEQQLKKGSLKAYDKIIVVIAPFENNEQEVFQSILSLADKKNVILVYAHHPKHLNVFKDFKTIIYTPFTEITAWYSIPDIIYGSRSALGQFPLNISSDFQYGQGINLTKKLRLNPAFAPEEVDCDHNVLNQIDDIVAEGIKGKAMPSCQVMVIKKGKIIYDQSFGYHTYSKKVKVDENHLYDLASITKVVSTTMAMMKLYQQGKYSLSDSLYQVFGKDSLSTVAKVTLRELMVHQSGIQSFMPIVRYLRNKDEYDYFSTKKLDNANTKIANGFYLYDKWLDTLWREMTTLELQDNQTYRYSDVNANIMQRVVETLTEKSLDEYVNKLYYEPLNMNRTLYNPLDKYSKKEIVPTEKDNSWRKQLVHGYVHDESAAMLGGVGGNAGLFSTANDLAVLSQMLLNGGKYGNQQFLQKETIDLFTASTHGNHRGLGFNKQTETGTSACSQYAPLSTYGHTGFTGNCFWVDPENELIYIFLSNRVYPKRNSRLSKMQIRERIHDVIYESFL